MDTNAPIVDEAEVMKRVDGDRELLGELAELFLVDCAAQLARVREAVERRDRAAMQSTAHALKGSVSNFAAKAACDAARDVETMGRMGQLDKADSAMASLEREIGRLTPVLESFARNRARKP
jgi:HPt (histidine-containing phosphotransfer) domain-containing protein